MAQDPYFFFDPERLRELAQRHRGNFAQAQPFAHVALDSFLPEDAARRLLSEFPPPEAFADNVDAAEPRRKGKLMSAGEETLSGFTRHLLYHLNSSVFLGFLEDLTGIEGLISDPEVGTALRHFERGGCLGVHADSNWHKRLRVDRRLNLILYLNDGWRPEYGGALELWDAGLRRCVRSVEPLFNRCIIFATLETGYHGFPDPLKCPPGETRKTLQLYYFTNGRDAPAPQRVGTDFRWRTQDLWSRERLAWMMKRIVRALTPPVLFDLALRLKRLAKGGPSGTR